MYKRIVEGKCTQTVCTCRPGPCLNPSPVSTTAQGGAGEKVTGSWSNDAELIALCMDMLGDIPGETLDVRIERLVGAHLEALSTPPAPGFGFSWTKLCADAASIIRRQRRAANPPGDVREIKMLAADAIRTFCKSLGEGTVAISTDGMERIYYSGLSLDGLAAAVAMKLASPKDAAATDGVRLSAQEGKSPTDVPVSGAGDGK
jgi:hypothetical protein